MLEPLLMPSRPQKHRSPCPISSSLDLFGDRWTLLILRDVILFDRHRYRDFLASPEGIASNILSDRLKRLEAAGLITKSPDPADRRQVIYEATDKGAALKPVMLEIAAWGAAHGESGAPPDFAERYYANRARFLEDHQTLFENFGPPDT